MAMSPAFMRVLSSKVTMDLHLRIFDSASELARSSTDGGRWSGQQIVAGKAALSAGITCLSGLLLALARNTVERLRQPFHLKYVGALQSAIGRALEHQIAAFTHRFDQL